MRRRVLVTGSSNPGSYTGVTVSAEQGWRRRIVENARRVEAEGRLGREPPWGQFAPPVEPCPCALCRARFGAVSE